MIELYERHTALRTKPVNLSEKDLTLFAHELKKNIRSAHLLSLKNVYVLNDLIFDLRKLRFYNKYTHVEKIHKEAFLNSVLQITHRRTRIENAVWIIDEWSPGYFHWFSDALPRLLASKSFMTNHDVLLPDHYKNHPFIIDSLRLLGFKIVHYDPASCVCVENLLLPSHVGKSGNYNKGVINELRDGFLKSNLPEASRKIYVSRKKASRRKISNEEEVQTVFTDHGYEIHYFEDYTFNKQVEIMSQSKSLAGLHGAGLTNMLFMRKGSNVLEFRNYNDPYSNCYFSLASDLGIGYYYQLTLGNSTNTHIADVTVDLGELKKNLELMTANSHVNTEELT